MGAPAEATNKGIIHFFSNGVYSEKVGGGHVHTVRVAAAAMRHGYRVNFFGGHALKKHLESALSGHTITLTDSRQLPSFNDSTIAGQFSMLRDYARRLKGTCRALSVIREHDLAFAVGDYWYDVLPLTRCRSQGKALIYHMQAPSFREIVTRGRADVDPARLAALHYWLSQNNSLRSFRRCTNKRLLFVHPNMRDDLLKRGYREDELQYISFGVDPEPLKAAPAKTFDVVWIGRKHRQKGVEDLLQTLMFLRARVNGFRAVLIGKLQEDLEPEIEQRGLKDCVTFAGFVSEEEKFRLFGASRVFLMPSRFEGSPRVIAEALVCGLPVVAYDVPTYRPLFREFLRYVPCFDVTTFQRESEQQILNMRAGVNYLDGLDLDQFRRENSWERVEQTFCMTMDALQASIARLRSPSG